MHPENTPADCSLAISALGDWAQIVQVYDRYLPSSIHSRRHLRSAAHRTYSTALLAAYHTTTKFIYPNISHTTRGTRLRHPRYIVLPPFPRGRSARCRARPRVSALASSRISDIWLALGTSSRRTEADAYCAGRLRLLP